MGKGQAVEGRSRDAAARAGAPAQGQGHRGGWQDSCAVHDLGASDGESAPWRQDVRAAYSPTALCGAFRMHGAHILPRLAVSEYMAAICCREPVLFSSRAPSGTHRGAILPWPAAWERTGAISCHGQAPDDHHRSSSTAYLRLQWGTGQHTPLRLRGKSGRARLYSAEKKNSESKASIPRCNQAVCRQTLRTIVIRNSLNASI